MDEDGKVVEGQEWPKWLTTETPLNRYDALVMSPAQIECMIAYRSHEPGFKEWLRFGVKYRPLLENMKELVLVARGITVLGDGLGELTNLEVLDVHKNGGLTEITEGALAKLNKLKKLYAFGCKLAGEWRICAWCVVPAIIP